MSKQPFFSIRDYRLNFNTFDGVYQVLDGVNLNLERGQSLGIVGETGCGKSVTVRNIPGLRKNRMTRKWGFQEFHLWVALTNLRKSLFH